MNFFGHAYVATRDTAYGDDPAFILGAMLPDFASMCRARLGEVTDTGVRAGVAHHHAVDARFHRAPEFVALETGGRDALAEAGLRPVVALACAHVGTELLLDGLLLEDDRTVDAYLGALDDAPARAEGITWRARPGDDGAPERWRALHARLSSYGAPSIYRDPEAVAGLLERILGARPRLQLEAGQRAAVADWLHGVRPAVETAREPLLRAVLGA